jgi:hypothetical protein
VTFLMGNGGQEAGAVHGAGPAFGRHSGSEDTDAGYRHEGWCGGGDESIGGVQTSLCQTQELRRRLQPTGP